MTRRRGFTMIEILVTMGIIVVLIGLLVVAAGGARDAALASTTTARLDALSQAVTRFEADTGYLPPLLDNDRAGIDGVEPTRSMANGRPAYLTAMQRRYSYTSPAEYLLGYGTEAEDGYGIVTDESGMVTGASDGFGLRRPGEDGFWNASWNDGVDPAEGVQVGRYELRERRPDRSGARGTVLGPYLELDDPSMLGAIGWDGTAWDGSIDPATNQPMVFYPGDSGYDEDAPKVIVDGWGTPIRYYRVNHPAGQPATRYPTGYKPASDWSYAPSMAEYFALRPWEVDEGESVTWWFTDASGQRWGDYSSEDGTMGNGDPIVNRPLLTGRFAFLSAGGNRRVYDWARVDFPGAALSGLSDGRGDHAAADPAAGAWYEDGMSLPWLGAPAFDAGVTATEEANRDNIVEVGQ
ncbi:MAG: type II secretion system protein [Phycisphaerales bacterium]|jgi:prepilin-type N-terminal cleavage/methylation domain-containing protein|nr:type II secretion system protein [Phycisphaerales bacterium]